MRTESMKTLRLYRGLLHALRHYPSSRKLDIREAIKEEFRAKRNLSGKELEKALWLGQMELKRLETWIPTGKQMADGCWLVDCVFKGRYDHPAFVTIFLLAPSESSPH